MFDALGDVAQNDGLEGHAHRHFLVLEAIEQVNRELGTTTALITHNAGIAEMADRVIRFGDGRIVEVRENPTRRAASELEW